MKKTIEERVGRLEKIFWVVGVVAVIFGLSGGWGYNLLQSAKTELEGLSEEMGNAQSEIKRATEEEKNKIIDNLTMEASKQLAFVPVGAVMAFDLKSCPEGWKEAEFTMGRFIIGVGEGTGLTPRYLLEEGGVEKHQLTIDEMPKHSHNLNGVTINKQDDYGFGGSEKNIYESKGSTIKNISEEVGMSEKHDNMPPYVALLYCEKQ